MLVYLLGSRREICPKLSDECSFLSWLSWYRATTLHPLTSFFISMVLTFIELFLIHNMHKISLGNHDSILNFHLRNMAKYAIAGRKGFFIDQEKAIRMTRIFVSIFFIMFGKFCLLAYILLCPFGEIALYFLSCT